MTAVTLDQLVYAPMVPVWAILASLIVAVAAVVAGLARGGFRVGTVRWARRILLLCLLSAVLLRPALPAPQPEAPASSADVFFVVDTTSSIAATDWAGGLSRLDGIRSDVHGLVAQLEGARFALIGFDSVASVRVPLTSDAAALLSSIDVTRPVVSAYGQGSSAGLAAGLLRGELERAAEESPHRSRVVYYLGDGEQTAAGAPESFSASSDLIGGGAVFGYGSDAGGTMPYSEGADTTPTALIIDPATGAPAVSVPDPAVLATIAAELDVPFEVRDPTVPVESGALHLSALGVDGGMTRTSVTELYWIPAAGVLVLLVAELASLALALLVSAPPRPARRRR